MSGDIDGDDRARNDNVSRLATVQQAARELHATLAPHGALSARLPDRDTRSRGAFSRRCRFWVADCVNSVAIRQYVRRDFADIATTACVP